MNRKAKFELINTFNNARCEKVDVFNGKPAIFFTASPFALQGIKRELVKGGSSSEPVFVGFTHGLHLYALPA